MTDEKKNEAESPMDLLTDAKNSLQKILEQKGIEVLAISRISRNSNPSLLVFVDSPDDPKLPAVEPVTGVEIEYSAPARFC